MAFFRTVSFSEQLPAIMGNGVMTELLMTIERYISDATAALSDLPANIYSDTLSMLLGYIGEKSRLLLKAEVVA